MPNSNFNKKSTGDGALFNVRHACHNSIGCKSRTDQLTGTDSLKQGCPEQSGI